MQISLNTFFPKNISKSIYFNGTKQINHKKNTAKTPADCFTKSNNTDFTLEKFLNKKDRFTISEFRAIDKGNLIFLRDDLTKEYGDYDEYAYAAGATMELAFDLKSALDEKYGENGYVFTAIGQSPSLIAKVFECMGVETKYLPISNLGEKGVDIDILFEEKTIENYGKILKRQNLTKEALENSDKKVIFYDYTSSGATLAILEYFMQKAYKLPYSKIEFRSLNEDLQSCAYNSDNAENYIKTFLEDRWSSKFTSIDHLPHKKIADTAMDDRNLTRHRFCEPKLFNFLIMDELNKMGLLKENPANRNSL